MLFLPPSPLIFGARKSWIVNQPLHREQMAIRVVAAYLRPDCFFGAQSNPVSGFASRPCSFVCPISLITFLICCLLNTGKTKMSGSCRRDIVGTQQFAKVAFSRFAMSVLPEPFGPSILMMIMVFFGFGNSLTFAMRKSTLPRSLPCSPKPQQRHRLPSPAQSAYRPS